jgi:hypothetical protein
VPISTLIVSSNLDHGEVHSIMWYRLSPVSSTNKIDGHDTTEILLKVALNTIKQTNKQIVWQIIVVIIAYQSYLNIFCNGKIKICIVYGSWIYNYLSNRCLSPLLLWVRISITAKCIASCDKGFLRFPPPINLTATIQLKCWWKWR